MDHYLKIYIESFEKHGGLGDVARFVGNTANNILVEPLKGMYTNTRDAITSASYGDWNAAGASALNALGDTAMTALNATMFVPGIGTGIGLAGRAALAGGRALSLANKIKGVSTVAKGIGTVGGKIQGAGNLINRVGTAARTIGEKIPGGEWLGFAKPTTKGVLKPMLKMLPFQMATMGGASILDGRSYKNKFENLAVDPNFREWFGPDRQDAMLEHAITPKQKVIAMKTLERGGYLDDYKKDTQQALEKERKFQEGQAAVEEYKQRRMQAAQQG